MAARRAACWRAWPNCSLNPRNCEKRRSAVHFVIIPTMKFGAHMSASGGVWRALQRGRGIRCEIVQVLVNIHTLRINLCSVQLIRAAMNTNSLLNRVCNSSIPRRAAVMLVALAWSNLAFGGEIHDAARKGDLDKVKAL